MEQSTTQAHDGLLQIATLAADMWAIDNADRPMTNARRTRMIVETAVMHLIEQGLLVVPDDIAERLDRPISMTREGAPGE